MQHLDIDRINLSIPSLLVESLPRDLSTLASEDHYSTARFSDAAAYDRSHLVHDAQARSNDLSDGSARPLYI